MCARRAQYKLRVENSALIVVSVRLFRDEITIQEILYGVEYLSTEKRFSQETGLQLQQIVVQSFFYSQQIYRYIDTDAEMFL